MFSITGLVVPVPLLGERPSECCVDSHFLLCFICACMCVYVYLQCVTAFAWVVVIYCVAQFCNRGSLNRTLHVPTFIISLTWCSIIILYQLANGCIKQRFNGACVFSVPLTCFHSFLPFHFMSKLCCTDTSRLIRWIRSCMNCCNNQKYNEV